MMHLCVRNAYVRYLLLSQVRHKTDRGGALRQRTRNGAQGSASADEHRSVSMGREEPNDGGGKTASLTVEEQDLSA
jgi:hypothetical protein